MKESHKFNFVSYNQLQEDVKKFCGEIPRDKFDVIVGIPRSGMVVASIMSCHMNKCLGMWEGGNNVNAVRSYGRGPKPDKERFLIVDDTSYTGNTIKKVKAKVTERNLNCKFAVLYSSGVEKTKPDYILEKLYQPRAFEWNLFNGVYIKNAMMDIDGVICYDPHPSLEVKDTDGYIQFIRNPKPLYLPQKFQVKCLTTNRLEKYRKETEEWLSVNSVNYEKLIMCSQESLSSRRRFHSYGRWKGERYKNSSCQLFIESSLKQTKQIISVTDKPVLCIEDMKVY